MFFLLNYKIGKEIFAVAVENCNPHLRTRASVGKVISDRRYLANTV